MIEQLIATSIKREDTLPFSQTDAGHTENLALYFDGHIPNLLRAKGQEFLEGKVGEYVRMHEGRIYFKWQRLKRFCQGPLHLTGKDIDALKIFISKKGGYQGEEGAREWYRWTYWVPLEIFDGQWKMRWTDEDVGEGGSNG